MLSIVCVFELLSVCMLRSAIVGHTFAVHVVAAISSMKSPVLLHF